MTEKKSSIVSLKRLKGGSAKIRMEILAEPPQMPFPLQVSTVIDPETAGRLDRCSLKAVELALLKHLNLAIMLHMEDLRRDDITQ